MDQTPENADWKETLAEQLREVHLTRTIVSQTANDVRSIKGWITFIGVLIIIGLVLQLLGSCLA